MPEKECIHVNVEVIEEFPNGWFEVRCNDCGKEWIDG